MSGTENKSGFSWSKRKVFSALSIAIILTATFTFLAATNLAYPVGYNDAYPVAYNQGYKTGVSDALTNVANLLQTKGITVDWNVNTDGTYTLKVMSADGTSSATLKVALNLVIVHRNAAGQVIQTARGAGTFTNLGKNWTIQQILNGTAITSGGGTSGVPVTGNTGINATTCAIYLGDATTAASSATSTVQPTETQANGLGRATATSIYYSAGSGQGTIGQFNCTVTKTCTPSGQTSAEWGLYYRAYAAAPADQNSLIAYDSTPGSKNLASGDTLQETWTGTFS
jgi:hypothetical protein